MKYLLVLSGLLLPLGLATSVMAQATPYPKPLADKMQQDCVAGAPSGAAPASVTTQCQCFVSAIQTRISAADYSDLDAALKAQKPLTEKQAASLKSLQDGSQSCAKPGAK
jgi:hypothetical protein